MDLRAESRLGRPLDEDRLREAGADEARAQVRELRRGPSAGRLRRSRMDQHAPAGARAGLRDERRRLREPLLGNAAGRALQRVRQSRRAQQAEIPQRLQLHLARLDADGEQPPQTAIREADPLPHAAQEQQRGGRGAFAGGHERQVEMLPAECVNPVQETRSEGDGRTRRRDDDEVVHAPGQPRRLPADAARQHRDPGAGKIFADGRRHGQEGDAVAELVRRDEQDAARIFRRAIAHVAAASFSQWGGRQAAGGPAEPPLSGAGPASFEPSGFPCSRARTMCSIWRRSPK